jgi:hypothetical protein
MIIISSNSIMKEEEGRRGGGGGGGGGSGDGDSLKFIVQYNKGYNSNSPIVINCNPSYCLFLGVIL